MINLMPPAVKEDIRYARLNVLLVQYCILAALVSLGLVATMFFGLTLLNNDEQLIKDAISQREKTLENLKADEDRARELSGQITTISGLLNKELDYSEVITQIGGLIPQGATLQALNLQQTIKQEPLSLTVSVDNQEKAAVVQQNFENSPLFAGADIQSITPATRSEGGAILSYTVALVVSYTGEVEADE